MPINKKDVERKYRIYKSEFITNARLVHGDKYGYNIDEYISPHIKMGIICQKHGRFMQKPYDHLNGKGCKKCATELHVARNSYTLADFIFKARAKHGDRYGYDKAVYINIRSNIIITCKIHGDFVQKASIHLEGAGCPHCAKLLRISLTTKTTAQFIAEAKEIHGGKYGYDKTVYIHSSLPVILTCEIHGDFEQVAGNHLLGRGCVKCANNKAVIDNSLTREEFIERARAIHGDKYDYSKVKYINMTTNVILICSVHGEFEQTPGVHLRGSGCKKCVREKRTRTTEEFIREAEEKHGLRYDYSQTLYTGCFETVIVGCRVHGPFTQQANAHLRGSGCPRCAESRGERDVAKVLDKLNIRYIRQHMIPKNLYKYDFYLPESNVFIEYHGIQHYFKIDYFHRETDSFAGQVTRDQIKKELVKAHNGKLIVVRYNLKTLEQIENFLLSQLRRFKAI